MKIKDEWRQVAADRLVTRGDAHKLSVQALDAVLSVVAPLIAADVIEACISVMGSYAWCADTEGLSMTFRREVPKMLGLDAANDPRRTK